MKRTFDEHTGKDKRVHFISVTLDNMFTLYEL